MEENPPNTIQSLQSAVLRFAQDRDWLQFHQPKNLTMAIAVEAAELMEGFMWSKAVDGDRIDAKSMERIKEELADVSILCMQLANVVGIDLGKIVRDKLRVNEQKYPVDKARGSSNKYTDL